MNYLQNHRRIQGRADPAMAPPKNLWRGANMSFGSPRGVATDFWVGGRIIGSVATYPQNNLKIGKKHRIWATSFSNLVGSTTPSDFKIGGYGYLPTFPPGGDAPGPTQNVMNVIMDESREGHQEISSNFDFRGFEK